MATYYEDDLYHVLTTGLKSKLDSYIQHGLDADHVFTGTRNQDSLGRTLVEVAVLSCQPDMVRMLLKAGCNVNLKYVVNIDNFQYKLCEYSKKDRLKLSSIYPCIVKGNLEMVTLLVEGDFDVNIYDDRGCTALWHAVDLDNYKMAKVIMNAKCKCDVNIADVTMLRAIHVAAMRGNAKITSLLLRHGAIVDAIQLRGSTPLVLAVRAGCFDTTRLLVLNGADVSRIGYNGHTPLSTALQCCTDRSIPDLLLEAGAYVSPELLEKFKKDKLRIVKDYPDIVSDIMILCSTPRSLKMFCCLSIRKNILTSSPHMHFVKIILNLPLPSIIKEWLLLGQI